ncbi:unnamed protein product [Pelagomonas calceolata]|jgi:hypothetical protein|uniref:Uncharacterized protein n=1 Tax=Pelagomonas calceolata TaxID=35677 RepID=A0A8J2WSR5_9STRA|nr:unnamed protein product [Pelagomonas calceolata]|mmetsp:Transcript_19921/g.56620  ORF Transcript_19921/g.56620 Transcript_19921/m.56620 type:complete len:319 (-) Transcript_19921:100-1056(-)
MQAHLASVLKGVVKDKSKGALSRLLGERAAASRLLERIHDGATWHARIGIVLVDDARLRSYTPRAAVEWALRYETDLGLECTRGGTWFSQQPGSKLVDAEAYVSRTALLDRDAAPGEGPWTRAPDDRKVMATAGETRHLLRAKAEGWTTADFKGTKEVLKRDVLSSDSVASSPFGVDIGPDAILASLGAYHATYEPADVMIQDVVVGSGDDRGLFAARRTLACASKGEENLDSDRELIFGEIAADTDGAARLRYVRSIFDPEASVRRPATLPTSYPQASHFSNFANLYNLRTTYGGDRPAAEASPGMPQENWMVTQEA